MGARLDINQFAHQCVLSNNIHELQCAFVHFLLSTPIEAVRKFSQQLKCLKSPTGKPIDIRQSAISACLYTMDIFQNSLCQQLLWAAEALMSIQICFILVRKQFSGYLKEYVESMNHVFEMTRKSELTFQVISQPQRLQILVV